MNQASNESNLSDPTLYRDYSRILIRDWVGITTPHEFVLLVFILDRTIGWGKEWETISWDQFMNGVHGPDGRCYNRGTGMPRRTLAKMLKALQTDGFVLTRPGPSQVNQYALALDRKHSEHDMFRTSKKHSGDSGEESGPKFRVSRKGGAVHLDDDSAPPLAMQARECHSGTGHSEKPVPQRHLTGAPRALDRCTSGTLRDTERKEVTRNKETDVMPDPADSGDILTRVLKDSQLKAESRIARILQSATVSGEELAHLLHMSWRAFFADAPYCSPKKKDIMATLSVMKKYCKNPANTVPFTQFFRWCIEHWRMVMSESFYWMDVAPALPSMLFFVKHVHIFEQTFARREELKARANMTPKERRLQDLLHKQGMDYQLALAQVEEEFAPKVAPPPILYSPRIVQQIAPKYVAPKPLDYDLSKIDYDSLSRV